jgi:hypothetical protein
MQRRFVYLFLGLGLAMTSMFWIGPDLRGAPARSEFPEDESELEPVPDADAEPPAAGKFQFLCAEPLNVSFVQLLVPVTSRTAKGGAKRIEDLILLKHALPSIIASVEPDAALYWIAIGADAGDPWYDSTAVQDAIAAWFRARWQAQWPRVCPPRLTFHVYKNTRSRNVWSVNYMAQEGYANGVDYFYRINDDTELIAGTNWTSVFISELARMRPIPGLGVVCPQDPNHKTRELCTMSFVSWMHLVVFGTMFSFLTGNQYSDDWITMVYHEPHAVAIYGTGAHMLSILPEVPIVHKTVPFRYVPKTNQTRAEQQIALDRQELDDYVLSFIKKLS